MEPPASIETALAWFREAWAAAELSRAWTTGDPKRVKEAYERTQTEKAEAKPTPKFELIQAHDMECSPPDYLVSKIFETDSLVEIFGDPATAKPYVALGLGCCIATKTDWHGHSVQSGPVVYVAAEGRNWIARRRKAWEIRNGMSLSDAPFYLSNGPTSLCDPDAKTEVISDIDQIGTPPKLIIFDTLARNFGPGDENSTQDMAAAIQTLDTIRSKYRCTVLLIHHTGHADKNRARGAMALKGALDAEYRLDKDESGIIRLTPIKMKEAEFPEPMAFRLRTVQLGMQDAEGQEVASTVLDRVDYIPTTTHTTKAGRGKW